MNSPYPTTSAVMPCDVMMDRMGIGFWKPSFVVNGALILSLLTERTRSSTIRGHLPDHQTVPCSPGLFSCPARNSRLQDGPPTTG